MFKRVWIKFLLLLLAVSFTALSSAVILRELMIKDFREYIEGEMIDHVYWITSAIEGSFERYGGWQEDTLVETSLWALMLGFEVNIINRVGQPVMDTAKAIDSLSPLARKRFLAASKFEHANINDKFIPFTLFLGGKEIGRIEVRQLRLDKKMVYIKRSAALLMISTFAVGGLAVIISFIFSKRLTLPIERVSTGAIEISKGNFKSRVSVTTNDEIGKLSESFNTMAHALEVQENLRKKLTSNIAHELRTPIAAIRGELEAMMDGVIPADVRSIQSLYDEIGRLKNIVEGVEDLSRVEASALKLKKEDLYLKPFLQNITGRYNKLFSDKGITLALKCEDSLAINADPDALSRIVINLLGNALKATGHKGEVTISAELINSNVSIKVSDTGLGIKEEDLPFIFERFYKVIPGGIGIGLTITKELVEAHGGTIAVESVHGKGSVFTVTLPS
jgi:signal transduction histidine kinase